jgi:Trypsin-co-occurring domain 1
MPDVRRELAEFQYEGGTFLVEVEQRKGSEATRAALPNTEEMVAQAGESFEHAIDRVIPVAIAAIKRIRKGLTDPADEVEVKFGIKLSVEAGAFIAAVGGEANFEVVLKWKHDKPVPSPIAPTTTPPNT